MQASGKVEEAHRAMQRARQLDKLAVQTGEWSTDSDFDTSVLPMKPRDVLVPSAIYRLGIFSFVKVTSFTCMVGFPQHHSVAIFQDPLKAVTHLKEV